MMRTSSFPRATLLAVAIGLLFAGLAGCDGGSSGRGEGGNAANAGGDDRQAGRAGNAGSAAVVNNGNGAANGGAGNANGATRPSAGGTNRVSASSGGNGRRLIGTIQHKPITESSGIIASRKHAGVFWTHCDSGNDATLYAITREGTFLAEYPVRAENDDWEDIATDDAGHLYIGDIGNNGGKRKKVEVHRVNEPNPAEVASNGGNGSNGRGKALRPTFTWVLRYPDQPFDSEALFVLKDKGYLISKSITGVPATVYRFALDEGRPEAVLERVCTLPIRSPVTAADVSADGARLAVLTMTGVHVFRIDGDVAAAGRVRPVTSRAILSGIEACTFVPEGVLVTSESREIYLFPDASFR